DQIKPVIVAPETMLAKKMMQNLLKEKKSMAIVVDEFGGTAGMITLEDLVEEIFGDIEDEHDRRKLVARKTGENSYEFSGRMEIERINEQFDLDLPESDDYQTIAGYIVNRLEMIPNQGEEHTIDRFTVSIAKKNGARLELITLKVNSEPEDEKE
ncbi:MAG: hemolysin, partial [Muribaculaceae bacterium]|nr:hemolysin [Muribaculaceae bacterium]